MSAVLDSAPTPPTPPADNAAGKGSPPRLLQLDILRGAAILMVINFHFVLNPAATGFLSPLMKPLQRMGWTGVDLFFVLSGFLIGGLLFQEFQTSGRIDIRRFLTRRAFKIWPSYYLYLAFLAAALHFTNWLYKENGTNSLLPNLLHYQNYTIPPRNHTWSLAVEEHFYLLLPFLLMFLAGRDRTAHSMASFPWVAAAVMGICLALRLLVSFRHPWALNTHFTPTHLRLDGLLFGVLIAYFFHFRAEATAKLARYRIALFLCGLALILPAAFFDYNGRLMSVLGLSLLYLGYGCVLVAVVQTPLHEGRAGRALVSPLARAVAFIGVYSYPIYLWHIDCGQMPLRYLVKRGFLGGLPASLRWLLVTILYVAAATAVGFVMGRLVEKPALMLRDKLFPSRVEPLAQGVAAIPVPAAL